MELGTWCWPRVVLIEKRPLTECERSSMNWAARSVGLPISPATVSRILPRFGPLGHRITAVAGDRATNSRGVEILIQ